MIRPASGLALCERRRRAASALDGLAVMLEMLDPRAELPAGELAALVALVADAAIAAIPAPLETTASNDGGAPA